MFVTFGFFALDVVELGVKYLMHSNIMIIRVMVLWFKKLALISSKWLATQFDRLFIIQFDVKLFYSCFFNKKSQICENKKYLYKHVYK